MRFDQVPTRSVHGGENDNIFAEFFMEAVELGYASQQAGRPIFEDRPHVRIIIAGDSKTEMVREVTQRDKERFAGAWAAFEKGVEGAAQSGTPLKQWPEMTPALIKNFSGFSVYTVEALAALTDSQIQSIGMGAREWSAKAKAYLAHAGDSAVATRLAAENSLLKAEIEKLKADFASLSLGMREPTQTTSDVANLQDQIAQLAKLVTENVASKGSPITVQLGDVKRPVGRPKKDGSPTFDE
jgi:hypothetical protein